MGKIGTATTFITHTRIKVVLLEKEEFKINQLYIQLQAATIHTCNCKLPTTRTTPLFPSDQFLAKNQFNQCVISTGNTN